MLSFGLGEASDEESVPAESGLYLKIIIPTSIPDLTEEGYMLRMGELWQPLSKGLKTTSTYL